MIAFELGYPNQSRVSQVLWSWFVVGDDKWRREGWLIGEEIEKKVIPLRSKIVWWTVISLWAYIFLLETRGVGRSASHHPGRWGWVGEMRLLPLVWKVQRSGDQRASSAGGEWYNHQWVSSAFSHSSDPNHLQCRGRAKKQAWKVKKVSLAQLCPTLRLHGW